MKVSHRVLPSESSNEPNIVFVLITNMMSFFNKQLLFSTGPLIVVSKSRSNGSGKRVVVSLPPLRKERACAIRVKKIRVSKPIDETSAQYWFGVCKSALADPKYKHSPRAYKRDIVDSVTRLSTVTPQQISAVKKVYALLVQNKLRRDAKRKQQRAMRLADFKSANRYFVLPVEECSVTQQSWEEDIPLPRPIRSHRDKQVPLPKWDRSNRIFQTPPPLVRSEVLLMALRKRIAELIERRSIQGTILPARYTTPPTTYAIPQAGDDEWDVAPETKVYEDLAGNVCLQRQRDESKAETKEVIVPQNVSAGDQEHNFETLLNRWLLISQFKWSADSASGETLKSFILPAYFYKERPNSPNAHPFDIFQYWRGNMEVKIQVNANRFQVGQLQASWLYDTLADANVRYRDNIYSLSQTNHVLINAASSSPGILAINYQNPLTHLPITVTSSEDMCLNLGTLYIKVLNPLTCSSTTHNKCTVSVFIRFLNSEFIGMRSSSVGTFAPPQMMSMLAVSAAEKVLDNVLPDANRDNPIYSGARVQVTPSAVHNISIGKNAVEPMQALRLDALGQTPHMANTDDEMMVSTVAKRMGLIRIEEWKADHNYSDLIVSIDASPQPQTNLLNSFMKNSNKCYYLPPVAVISNLFAYWRGNLKVRIDVVASQYHTGRLLISYIPRTLTPVTIEEAVGSPHVVFDLQESQSITYEIPYITNRYWWPRRVGFVNQTDQDNPPGKLHIFVLNPLVPMDSVSNKVYLNIYWGASDCFEVAIPAQPAVGTCFWTTDDKPDLETKAAGGYFPWYWGYYGSFFEGKKAIARYGKGYSHVAQFTNMKRKGYYRRNKLSKYPYLFKYDGSRFYPEYFGAVDLNDGFGAIYMCVFETEAKAKEWVSHNYDYTYCMDIAPNDDGPWCEGNPIFDFVAANEMSDSSFVLVSPQAGDDERERETTPCATLPCPATNLSRRTFGEDHNNLKDLCRRFQSYGATRGQTSFIPGDVAFAFPVMPQGLDLDVAKYAKAGMNYKKFIRDGTIPLVLSGYRFFRGGVRFHLIFTPGRSIIAWAQHRPDKVANSLDIQDVTSGSDADKLLNAGYATALQCSSVNNALSFEVPYFNPFTNIYLQRPAVKHNYVNKMCNLGMVNVGLEADGKNKTEYTCYLFYSLADDAVFSTFQGFPPMLCLNELVDPKRRYTVASAQGLLDYVKMPTIKHSVDVTNPPAVIEHSHSFNFTSDMKDGLKSILSGISGFVGKSKTKICDLIMELLSQIGHIFINPTTKQICWAIASCIIKLGVVSMDLCDTLFKKLCELATYFGMTSGGDKQEESPPIMSQAGDDSIIPSFISSMFLFVSQTLSCIVHPPKNLADLEKTLTRDLSSSLRTSNFAYVFLKNNLEFFKKVVTHVVLQVDKSKLFDYYIQNEMHSLVDWSNEALTLLDPHYDERIYSRDSTWADRLEYCYIVGVKINQLFFNEETRKQHSGVYVPFYNLFSKICKKRDDAFKRGITSVSRREPMCIWLGGSAGIGKSQLAQSTMLRLIKSAGIRFEGEPIFTLPCGAKWWNGCRNQPCVYFDDFLNIRDGEMGQSAIADYWALKSPAVLNPPQAHLDNKEARYAPELMWVNCNSMFPSLVNIDERAFYRRRDILIRAELRSEFQEQGIVEIGHNSDKIKEICDAHGFCLQSFDHLIFYMADDPADPQTNYSGPYTYAQLLVKLETYYNQFYNHQVQLHITRKKEYEHALSGLTVEPNSLQDLKSDYGRLSYFMRNTVCSRSCDPRLFFRVAQLFVKNQPISSEMITQLGEISDELRSRILPRAQNGDVQEILNTLNNILQDSDVFFQCQNAGASSYLSPPEILDMFGKSVNSLNILDIKRVMDSFYNEFKDQRLLVGENRMNARDIVTFLVSYFIIARCSEGQDVTSEKLNEIIGKLLLSFQDGDSKVSSSFVDLIKVIDRAVHNLYPISCPHWQLTPGHEYYPEYEGLKEIFMDDKGAIIPTHNCVDNCLWANDRVKRYMILSWFVQQPHWVTCPDEQKPVIVRDIFSKVHHPVLEEKKHTSKAYQMLVAIKNKFISALTSVRDAIVAAGGWCINFFGGIFSKFWAIIERVAPFLLGVIIVLGISKGVHAIAPNFRWHYNLGSQAINSGDNATVKAGRSMIKPPLRIFLDPKAQGISMNQQIESIIPIISRNVFYISVVKEDKSFGYPNRCLVIYENVVLILEHYIHMFKHSGATFVKLYRDQEEYMLRIADLELQQCGTDVGLLVVPEMVFKRDLRKFLCKHALHTSAKSTHYMLEPRPEGVVMFPLEVKLKENVTSMSVGTSRHDHSVCYEYKWEGPGRCGSILINPSSNRPIVGIHVAGTHGIGYAELLSAEMFAYETPKLDLAEDDPGIIIGDVTNSNVKEGFVPIGITDTGLLHAQSGETKIVKSLVHDRYFPCTTMPAPLKKGDFRLPRGVSPLWEGVKKMHQLTLPFEKKWLDIVHGAKRNQLITRCPTWREILGPLTYQEVVCGISGVMKGLDMHTSEGFPLSRYRPSSCSGKSYLFDIVKSDNPEAPMKLQAMDLNLHHILQQKHNLRVAGKIPNTYFDDNLKDARIPTAKCLVPGKTRIFSTSPVDYTIECKQYFGDFIISYHNNRIHLNHAIGIAPDGLEWANIVTKLDEIDGVYITGDYSNFGPSLNHGVLMRVKDQILAWYDEYERIDSKLHFEFQRVREIILLESINARHITHDFVWQAQSGIPSGCPLTVILNSEVNDFYIHLAWLSIFADDPKLSALCNFTKHVRLITFGDDLLMKVSHEVKDKFNNLTLSKFFEGYNIKFTDASKAGNIPYQEKLADCSFLKRGFKPHPVYKHYYLAPLDEETSVGEVINWIHDTQDKKAATEEAIMCANNNAYSLGPERFQYYHDIFNKALVQIKSDVILRTWNELDFIFFGSKL